MVKEGMFGMKKHIISQGLVLLFVFFAATPALTVNAQDYELVYLWNHAIYNSKTNDETILAEYKQPMYPGSAVERDNPDIITLANSIVADKKSDYEKAAAIHDWVSNNIWYDEDFSLGNSAIITMQNNRGICTGYTNLTVALLRAVDIPAIRVAGYAMGNDASLEEFFDVASNITNHVWTEAYIDGRWVIIDTTWDSNNVYRHGVYSTQKNCGREYFDILLKDISKSHRYALKSLLSDNYPVTEFIIPTGVTHISDFAFFICVNLRSITIPNSVTSIGDSAFLRCSALKNITIGNGITSIGHRAFSECASIERIVIPDSVTSIAEDAFSRIKDLTIYGKAGSYAETYAINNNFLFVTGTPFDTASAWARDEIAAAINAGLVPDSFAKAGWQNATSRLAAAEVMVIIIEKASGKNMTQLAAERGWDLNINGFSDTNNQKVTFLKYAGVTTGIGNNKYDPNADYTRAQIVTMTGRVAEVFFSAGVKGINPFTDVPDWAAPYVGYAAENGITQGVGGGLFDSNGVLQNQHTAVFGYRTFKVWK